MAQMLSGKQILSRNDERYTPKAVVDYFGPFNYDPCTTVKKADEFGIPNFDTIDTNGLDRDWTKFNRIWVNPPFSKKADFLRKAVETFNETGADIYFLCPIEYLTTKQFSSICRTSLIYIPTGRISFENGMPGGKQGKSPAFGSVIVRLYPCNEYRFIPIEELR